MIYCRSEVIANRVQSRELYVVVKLDFETATVKLSTIMTTPENSAIHKDRCVIW